MLTVPTLVLLVVAALAIAFAWRQRRLTRRLKERHAADFYRQLNALGSLHAELRFSAPLPSLNKATAGPQFLLTTARHALAQRPRVVVECGSGVSTLVLARCLQLNGAGHLYSLEHDPEFAQTVCDQASRQGLVDQLTVVVAPLRPLTLAGHEWCWYALDKLPDVEIDMLVIDGPPGWVQPLVRYVAGPVLFRRLAPGGVAFVDDANRGKEKEVLRRWAREFPHLRQQTEITGKGLAILVNPRS